MNGLTRWNPGWDPFQEMEEMMNRLPVGFNRGGELHKGFVPAMNVYEENNAIIIETPLAGIDPKDVSVSVEKGVLTVQGETKKEHEVDDKNYYRKEIRSGSFFRQVALPSAVNEEEVSAEFDQGMLKIRAPKAGPKAGKKIEVKIK